MTASSNHFPIETAGLPAAHSPDLIELSDGDQVELRIAPVAKRIAGATVRMLAYNGSIPGPTLRVKQGSRLAVRAINEGDMEATVHWHGLRLENRYDGTAETQTPMPVGGSFIYQLEFPDPGIYWYHPHIREDYNQEMGLYGNIVVAPSEPEYWPPTHRELALTLDDILMEDGRVAPFGRSETTYTAMGRFGNVLLLNGETELSLTVRRGEVVRFYLTNTANTRVFNVSLTGGRMKLVGGDSGRVEREQFVESVVIAPSERAVVDVLFAEPGQCRLQHRTPDRLYPLATIAVGTEPAQPSLAVEFERLRVNPDMLAERARIAPYLEAAPDKTLALVAEMCMDAPELPPGTTAVYLCPMHPEVSSHEPGRCPKCGMKLLAAQAALNSFACPMHPEVTSEKPTRCPKCGMKLVPTHLMSGGGHGEHHHEPSNAGTDEHQHHHEPSHDEAHEHHHQPSHDEAHEHHHQPAAVTHSHATGGIEWEDDMVEVNRMTTPENTRWKLIDRATGAEGAAIGWRFRVGDRVKIRLVNEMDSDHPMHHPFHIHGAGRFLVLTRDGVVEQNLVWKDTVLVTTGQTVDLLLDVSNPGRWMAHCHIAEHHESGMMFSFDVEP